jgi:ferredoxin--NADP+ reductase
MANDLGTEQRPLRVAIVGSGPSGFYAADALLSAQIKVNVDIFDRLPAPFGLVRYGVAPDHPKIKNVIKVYERTAAKDGFSFFGNVNVGKDISVAELRKFYDAIIFACGAETDKKLGIPGEDFENSHTATEFVAWYNGHPDYKDRKFDLSQEVAFVIGQGNVAMDVGRILSKTVEELKATDIARHALEVLANSRIKEVHLIGRRGPAQAAFTPPEIKEFGELADCDPVFADPADMELSPVSQKELEDPANAPKKKNYEILKEFASRGAPAKSRKFVIHFFKSPVEILGNGKVEKVRLERNELSGEPGRQKAKGTGQFEERPCGLFFRSVGYRGVPIEGVPFRDDWGVFPNDKGRITDNGRVAPGLYATGWIKRGPSGVIGTNKPDAVETVGNLLQDVGQLPPCPNPNPEAIVNFFKEKNIKAIRFDDWKKIDTAEVARGAPLGKPREKFVVVEEMLKVIGP